MTYYLMFQFTFMVLGALYATWRVVLAIFSILLFAVAALDRSLLAMLTVGDVTQLIASHVSTHVSTHASAGIRWHETSLNLHACKLITYGVRAQLLLRAVHVHQFTVTSAVSRCHDLYLCRKLLGPPVAARCC